MQQREELERWYHDIKEAGGYMLVRPRYAERMAEEYQMSAEEANRSFECWGLSQVNR